MAFVSPVPALVQGKCGLKDEIRAYWSRRAGFRDIVADPLTGIGRRPFATAMWSERLRLLPAHDHAFVVSTRKPDPGIHPQESRA